MALGQRNTEYMVMTQNSAAIVASVETEPLRMGDAGSKPGEPYPPLGYRSTDVLLTRLTLQADEACTNVTVGQPVLALLEVFEAKGNRWSQQS